MVRRFLLSLIVMFGAATGALAFDTPTALLKALYEPYLADGWHEDEMVFFSSRTRGEWEALFAVDPYGLGFSPIVDGQDFDLSAFDVFAVSDGDETAQYRVTFANFGAERDLLFTLVREPEGWLVDDIEALHGDYRWQLRAMIAELTAAAQ